MAVATTNLNFIDFGYVNEQYPSTHYNINSGTWYELGRSYPYYRYMFAKLSPFPEAHKHKQLLGIQFRLQVNSVPRNGDFFAYKAEDYDPETITWYTHPQFYSYGGEKVFYYRFDETVSGDVIVPASLSGEAGEVLTAFNVLNCEALCFDSKFNNYDIKTVLSNNNSISAVVTYNDAITVTSRIAYRSGPKSGYANPRNAITFSWDYNPFGYCADPTWGQTSATFYWKTSSDENYTAVSAGTSKSVTIAANTFPTAETISWYVTGTDDEGTTTQTDVFSFSTSAGAVTANCILPSQSVEDGSAPIELQWAITSADAQPASRVQASWRKTKDPDTSEYYHELFDVNEAITSYIVPANTFTAGEILWRIRVWNVDGTEGDSDAKTFICVTAPNAVNGLSATEVPFSTVSWQSGEQQAYQISVDGVMVKKAFGSDVYSYTLEEPLQDGNHTISVIVQGVYGFWSQPSEITVTIQNQSANTINLTGDFGIDANLAWNALQNADYYVYRDSQRIGHTSSNVFSDRRSLGNHSYYVINKLQDGNYDISNIVNGTTIANGTFISLLRGTSDWVDITISENSATEQSYSFNRRYALNHYSGAAYPVLELSPFEDFSGSYNFACKDYSTAKAFETFRGKEVIIKSRGDVVLVGAMVSLSSHYGDFINGYTFSIQRIHVEDYIDDTDA